MSDYPAKIFTEGFAPPGDDVKSDAERLKKPEERPGKQHKLSRAPIDDIYANGKPYKGANKLEGKVALITGGDSGIGRATAILYAIEGADSTIVYLPEEQQDAEDTRDYVSKKTNGERKVHLLALDMKSEENCKKAVEETVKTFGHLDILVLNAAQQLEKQNLDEISTQQWRDCFDLNIHHYFYVTKFAIPHLKPGSAIVGMCSINAFVGRPDLIDYTSTKGAIVSFIRGISNMYAPKGIRASTIAPGPVWTPLIPSTFSKDNVAGIDAPPLGRPGQPVEIATVAVFLASEDSSYITGATIHVNGGVVIN